MFPNLVSCLAKEQDSFYQHAAAAAACDKKRARRQEVERQERA